MDKLLYSILYAIRHATITEYGTHKLWFPNQLLVESDGSAWWLGYGRIPLTWSQRRSVRRAFARRHRFATAHIVSLGIETARNRGVKL